MNKLNEIIESLSAEMKLFEETSSRKHRTQVRKTLQQLKTECHSMRKQVLGTTNTPEPLEEPVAPVVEEPVAPKPVEEPVAPEAVEEHPIPNSQPQPVKKEKKEKKEKKKRKKE